jgi:hypothetical protein
MKYRLIGTNDYKVDILNTIAKNRKVEDIHTITRYKNTEQHSPFLLKNMDKAVEAMCESMKKDLLL